MDRNDKRLLLRMDSGSVFLLSFHSIGNLVISNSSREDSE